MKKQSMNNPRLYELSWSRKLLSLVFLAVLLSLSADRAWAQVTNAFDAASDAAYFGLGAPNGLDVGGQNGGFGFGQWTFAINTPSGGAGGSFIENNGPSGNSFDLWN